MEGAKPIGINIEQDEILFYPLLYWPITPAQPALSNAALAKVDAFMKTGGSILFDTRDQDGPEALRAGSAGGARARLKQLLRRRRNPARRRALPPLHARVPCRRRNMEHDGARGAH